MALDATVRARVDSKLKEEVEEILSEIGLTTSQAITLFLKGVKRERGIPFDLKIPNETTLKAMKEAKEGIGETISFEDFIKESKEQYAKSL
jgi:DNA-damage-inducible protein J